jgi:hypothetical protein
MAAQRAPSDPPDPSTATTGRTHDADGWCGRSGGAVGGGSPSIYGKTGTTDGEPRDHHRTHMVGTIDCAAQCGHRSDPTSLARHLGQRGYHRAGRGLRVGAIGRRGRHRRTSPPRSYSMGAAPRALHHAKQATRLASRVAQRSSSISQRLNTPTWRRRFRSYPSHFAAGTSVGSTRANPSRSKNTLA